MSWDEDFDRWFGRRRRWLGFNFEDMDRMFNNLFNEMFENMPKSLYKEEKQPDGTTIRRGGPFIYGYSMTMGPDGKPVIREFGNVKPARTPTAFGAQKPSLEAKEEREPLVDIISDDDMIRVIAELPGVDKKDITLNCSENTLTISVDMETRKYYKEIELPAPVDSKIGKAKYTNGVLEITLVKVKAKRSIGEKIKID